MLGANTIYNSNVNTNILSGQSSSASSGDLNVTKTADRSEAQPGDAVTYTITVTNRTNATLRNLRVYDSFIDTQLSITNRDGATTSPNQLLWTRTQLAAFATATFRYNARLSSSLANGNIVRNTVLASADGVTTRMAEYDLHILSTAPQTGVFGFGDLSGDKPQLTAAGGNGDASGAPLFVLISTFGACVGGFAAKKFLFL